MNTEKIVLNQIGYLPNVPKQAIFRGEEWLGPFSIVDLETREVVYTGKLTKPKHSVVADEFVEIGDFSELHKEGNYIVTTPDGVESYPFKIGKGIYKSLLNETIRFLYMQRCGQELTEEYANEWAHPSCHTQLATVYGTNEQKDVTGGWHDAGDYGRYSMPASVTIAELLLAYEEAPEAFQDSLHIPESNNGLPDILNEARYGIEWLFKMQDEKSGGVYHKVTCADFPGFFVMPEEEVEPLILCPISTTATADFAATMAMSYETYKELDLDFAKQCLTAAEKAWEYLIKTPCRPVVNPEGIVTGEYGAKEDMNDRYWAAAQLYKATGDKKYEAVFKEYFPNKGEYGFDPKRETANRTYINTEGADEELCRQIKDHTIRIIDQIVERAAEEPYGLDQETYFLWGSNMIVLWYAILGMEANHMEANEKYRKLAHECISYCLGKNPMGVCYVTGFGSKYPTDPHHRPSLSKKKVVPGMLVGGPNCDRDDEYMRAHFSEKDAGAKCYVDCWESYSTNEVTTYWNSTLIYALAKAKLVD